MENSDQILKSGAAPCWYLAQGEKWVGPLSTAEIMEKLEAQQVSVADYIWKKGQEGWKRICDLKAFQDVLPNRPKKTSLPSAGSAQIKPSARTGAPKVSSEKVWYLYYKNSQIGPFSQLEVERSLELGKIDSRVHAWRHGMKTWERMERLDEFKDEFKNFKSSTRPSPDLALEQRTFPRRPVVAKILMTDQQSVIVGVCRDISVGGLQVLTDQIPGKVGSKIKMNISPPSDENGLEPFVAEGVIVRILEDGRGFSFRFEQLGDRTKRAIEGYIESSG